MRNKNISERLKLVLESKKLSIRSFSRTIHCADTTIGAILKGKVDPGYSTIYAILETFPYISTEWLITGEGDMISDLSKKNNDHMLSEELYVNHVREMSKIILKKFEEYSSATSIDNILTSPEIDDTSRCIRGNNEARSNHTKQKK